MPKIYQAGRTKTAIDPRKLLSTLFGALQPYVKDYRRFIAGMEAEIKEWMTDWTTITLSGGKVLKLSDGTVGIPFIDEYGNESGAEYTYPSSMAFQLQGVVSLKRLTREVTQALAPQITDYKGFAMAFDSHLSNGKALKMLGQILAIQMKRTIQGAPNDWIDFLANDLDDLGQENLEGPVNGIFNGDNIRVQKVWFKQNGTNITVYARVSIDAEIDPEINDPGDQLRYAGQRRINRIASRWMSAHRKD